MRFIRNAVLAAGMLAGATSAAAQQAFTVSSESRIGSSDVRAEATLERERLFARAYYDKFRMRLPGTEGKVGFKGIGIDVIAGAPLKGFYVGPALRVERQEYEFTDLESTETKAYVGFGVHRRGEHSSFQFAALFAADRNSEYDVRNRERVAILARSSVPLSRAGGRYRRWLLETSLDVRNTVEGNMLDIRVGPTLHVSEFSQLYARFVYHGMEVMDPVLQTRGPDSSTAGIGFGARYIR